MRQIPPQQQSYYATTRPLGILGSIAAAIGLIVAAVFGAMFFVLLMGILLVAGLFVAGRIWWTTRGLRAELRRNGASINEALRQQAQARTGQAAPARKSGGETIEGEYREVDR